MNKLALLYRKPSALSLAVAQLEEAKRQSLDAEQARDHYEAMAAGLKKSIARLQVTIQQLSKEQENEVKPV